ncbi:SWPV2-ORF002 [Shearwaterpox virus]|uniref:SWPV2-ORF002 n=1 Tax=Shearwaterpox virus TaxID=1974596 RepID=A0A1V0QGT7_CNPV|nr:SWPV2-ORF311 [Shearwaterpox virus]QRM15633.1 c-type lectin-like protein [Penguinpox virus 2]QRM15962.1 c-type lectin-like protein [Albatrosspox virus]ARE67569.1 SWPV2-ORF002 [Shearwaterpox virus]QRM15957.1 c-type lectin-like protein [Penguinpox virus 2]
MERLGSYEVLESTSKLFARASSIYQKQKLAVILAVLSVILTIVIIVLLALLPKSVTYCPDDTEVVTIESSSPVTCPEPPTVTCPDPPTVTCPEVPSPSEPICSRIWVNHMGYCVRSLGPDVKYTIEDAKRYCEQNGATLVKNIDEHKKFLEYVWTGVTSYWFEPQSSVFSRYCIIGTQKSIPMYPQVKSVSCDERHSFICIKKGTDKI